MGTAGLVSIGNAAFLAVGAFAAVWCERHGVQVPLSLLLAGASAGFVGLIVALPGIRIKGIYFALSTLAAYYILLDFADDYQGKTVGAAGFVLPTPFAGLGLQGEERAWAWLLAGFLGAVVVLAVCFTVGRSGRAMRMIRTHELVAACSGIHVIRYKLLVFAGSSMVIGVAGGLGAYLDGSVGTASYPLSLAISYIAMIIVGGLDSVWGAVAGAAVIVVLPTASTNVVSLFLGNSGAIYGPDVAQILYGVLVIIVVVVARRGIAGAARWVYMLGVRLVARGAVVR